MTTYNTCKKCGRNLPTNYKYKKCESCRNKNIQGLKRIGKVIGGIAVTIVTLIKVLSGKDKS